MGEPVTVAAPSTNRLFWILAAAVGLALAVYVALPWFASTHLVRERLAVELSEWSGYRITTDDAPTVKVWPRFTATLSDVGFSDWNGPADRPVLQTEKLEIELSPWAVLWGDIQFSHARFQKPQLRVGTTANGYTLPSLPVASRLAQSIAQAKLALLLNPDNPAFGALSPFGVIEIVDGTVVVDDEKTEQVLISDVSATVDWPNLDGPGSVSARGGWRGQTVRLSARSDQPLLLLGGDETSFRAEMSSKLLTASFDGRVEPRKRKLSGSATVETPSVSDVLVWLDSNVPDGIGALPLTLSTRVEGEANRLNLDRLEVTVAGNSGSGALELTESRNQPSLAGTMAFTTLDLPAAYAVFAPSRNWEETEATPRTLSNWRKWLTLDLRVSASTATAWGTNSVTEIAASANVRDGVTVLDVSDASAFGGSIQGSLRLDEHNGGKIEARLHGDHVNGQALSASIGARDLLPNAVGAVSLRLMGAGHALADLPATADGVISANFGKGSFDHVDLDDFLRRVGAGEFFAVDDVAAGTLALDGTELKASVRDGVAKIDLAEFRMPGRKVALTGVVPLAGRGMALNGALLNDQQAATDGTPTRFFIGGSWDAPFVSPAVPKAPD